MTLKEATPRQEEILDRAFELVRESGLASLTMKKVAERPAPASLSRISGRSQSNSSWRAGRSPGCT